MTFALLLATAPLAGACRGHVTSLDTGSTHAGGAPSTRASVANGGTDAGSTENGATSGGGSLPASGGSPGTGGSTDAGGTENGATSGGGSLPASGGSPGTGGGSPGGSAGAAGSMDQSVVAYTPCDVVSVEERCTEDDPICLNTPGTVSSASTYNLSWLDYHVCSRVCESDDDCASNLGGQAVPRCVERSEGRVCELDCSGGRECPEGLECNWVDQTCRYRRYCSCMDSCFGGLTTVTCTGDCFDLRDVTCTRGCEDTEFTCVENG